MIQKLVFCVAVITLISDSANGESESVAYTCIKVFSLSIELLQQRGHPDLKEFPGTSGFTFIFNLSIDFRTHKKMLSMSISR